MKIRTRRRLFVRKMCSQVEVLLAGPDFERKTLLHEISLGGFKVKLQGDPPETMKPETRVRLMLPADYPQQIVIAGGQIIWMEEAEKACGIKLLYTNCPTLIYQKVVDQLHHAFPKNE